MTSSYNGWPASKDPKAIGVDPAFQIHGHRFPGGVKAGPVSVVLTYLGEQLHARVEPIDADAVKDDWGYVWKQSANSPSLLSCHASGTAIDWNATRHPNKKRRTFTRAQAAEINRILDELRTDTGVRVVQWRAHVDDGGCATGTADEMHFEIAKVTAAQVQQVADRLRSPKPDPAPKPDPDEEDDMRPRTIHQTIPPGGEVHNIALPPWDRADYGYTRCYVCVGADPGKYSGDLPQGMDLRIAGLAADGAVTFIAEHVTGWDQAMHRGINRDSIRVPQGTRVISIQNDGDISAGICVELFPS